MNGLVKRLGSFAPADEAGLSYALETQRVHDSYGVANVWVDAGITTWGITVYGAMSASSAWFPIVSLSNTTMDANRSAASLVPLYPFLRFSFNGATGSGLVHVNFME